MVFNEIAEQGQFTQILQRRLNMLGAAPAPALMPEIAPCIVLENDRPEWAFLKNERICGRDATQSAVAAQFSYIQLTNPVRSRTIITVLRIQNYTAAINSIFRAQLIDGGLVGWVGLNVANRDFRYAGEGSLGQLSRTTSVSAASVFASFARLNGNNDVYEDPIIITPGTSLIIAGTVVNTAIGVGIQWRERAAMPGELG